MKKLADLLVLGMLVLSGFAHARDGDFPDKPVRLVVGTPAGGPGDLISRAVAQKLSERLGQSVIVENRPGAGATLAAGMVAKAPPDGYTLLMVTSAHALTPSFYSLSYDPTKDFESIGGVGSVPLVVLVNKQFPANSIKELIDMARAKPGAINYASSGAGSSQHLTVELMMSETGVKMVHVPFKGTTPAMTSLIGGEVQLMVDPVVTAAPFVQGGRVKAVAIVDTQRSRLLPEVPTMAEAGLPGIDTGGWYGILAPAKTPAAALKKLREALDATLKDAAFSASLASQGISLNGRSGADFMKLIEAEITKWKPIIKNAGIRAE